MVCWAHNGRNRLGPTLWYGAVVPPVQLCSHLLTLSRVKRATQLHLAREANQKHVPKEVSLTKSATFPIEGKGEFTKRVIKWVQQPICKESSNTYSL